MKEIYLTLASNSSMGTFTNNMTTKFTTLLPKTVSLDGSWECGLVEIHFPMTLKNVTADHCVLKLGETECHTIPSGYYEDTQDIVLAMKKVTDQLPTESAIRFAVGGDKKIAVGSTKTLYVSDLLALQLGFEPKTDLAKQKKSVRKPNIALGRPSQMYVYCDIIEPQIVGDVMTPLLRIVSTDNGNKKFGENVVQEFHRPIYLPVLRREFETIEIDLRTHTGEHMPFLFGTLVVVLHLRRSNGSHQ